MSDNDKSKMPPSRDDDDVAAEGDDEALVIPTDFHDQVEETDGRDRRGLATGVDLDPHSLPGSYFHRVEAGQIIWAGVVVGEPQDGKYLFQVDEGLEGADRGVRPQIPISFDQMLADEPGTWRFYDTEQDQVLAGAVIRLAQEVERE